jgi:hypothetical protein
LKVCAFAVHCKISLRFSKTQDNTRSARAAAEVPSGARAEVARLGELILYNWWYNEDS